MGTNTGIDISGWIGALLVILADFMVSTRRVAGDALTSQLLNITGGILLICAVLTAPVSTAGLPF